MSSAPPLAEAPAPPSRSYPKAMLSWLLGFVALACLEIDALIALDPHTKFVQTLEENRLNQTEANALAASLRREQANLVRATAEQRDATNSLQATETNIAATRQQIVSIRETISSLQTETTALVRQRDALMARLSVLEEEKTTLSSRVSNAEERITRAATNAREIMRRIEALRARTRT